MKKNNKKGFTIVELVIVIAVIGILAAVLIPTFSGIVEKANASAALQEARSKYTEYLAAHPDEKILYIKNEDGKIYDINNEFKVIDGTTATEGVLTIGTCLKESNEAGTCPECGWALTVTGG